MDAAAPSVSVIISTYNWSSVLPCAIGSVLNQAFQDFEILVVGDGCTDDSGDVVAGIGDRRVRWINLRRTAAINRRPTTRGCARRKAR